MAKTDRELLELLLVKVDHIGTKTEGIETRIASMETRLDGIETRLGGMETRFDGMVTKIDSLEAEVTDIQVTLENETNKNIRIIAEGHMDLVRRLDEFLEVNHEKEMLMIRLNRLENEVRRLKERMEATV